MSDLFTRGNVGFQSIYIPRVSKWAKDCCRDRRSIPWLRQKMHNLVPGLGGNPTSARRSKTCLFARLWSQLSHNLLSTLCFQWRTRKYEMLFGLVLLDQIFNNAILLYASKNIWILNFMNIDCSWKYFLGPGDCWCVLFLFGYHVGRSPLSFGCDKRRHELSKTVLVSFSTHRNSDNGNRFKVSKTPFPPLSVIRHFYLAMMHRLSHRYFVLIS